MPPKKKKTAEVPAEAPKLKAPVLLPKTKTVRKTKKTEPKLQPLSMPAAPVAKPEPKVEACYITIDYPTDNEAISGLHYAIRIGASEGIAEISINKGDWQPCRHSAGYWWFDWGYFSPGKQTLVARLKDRTDKLLKKSTIRKCEVI